MPQRNLFPTNLATTNNGVEYDGNALVRSSHPDTSREAAEHISARLSKREAVALEALRRWPGQTAAELEANALAIGLITRDGQIWKRLSGLEAKGKVRRASVRICRANGTRSTVWEAV